MLYVKTKELANTLDNLVTSNSTVVSSEGTDSSWPRLPKTPGINVVSRVGNITVYMKQRIILLPPLTIWSVLMTVILGNCCFQEHYRGVLCEVWGNVEEIWNRWEYPDKWKQCSQFWQWWFKVTKSSKNSVIRKTSSVHSCLCNGVQYTLGNIDYTTQCFIGKVVQNVWPPEMIIQWIWISLLLINT